MSHVPHANMEIKLTEAQKIKVLNGNDVFAIMQKVLLRENKIEQDKEHFWIIGLNINSKILFIELVSLGGMKATIVEPINVFRVAVMKNAAKAILVHNHPSGDLVPSADDKDITDRLMQVGRIIDVTVIDHLIISTANFYSFVDSGLHTELKRSLKWVPPFEMVERIKAVEQEIREEAVRIAEQKAKEAGLEEGLMVGEIRGMEKKALEIARTLKQRGLDSEFIAETAGLSVSKIEKL